MELRGLEKASEGLRELLDELTADASLRELNRFRERTAALERLDAYDLEGRGPGADGKNSEGSAYHRARAVYAQLEATNVQFCETIREQIRQGEGAKTMLRWLGPAGAADGASEAEPSESYDYRDELVRGVLQFAAPVDGIRPLAAEMVAYQPTPARHIFDLLRRAEFTERDELVDLGAGFGHVSLLTAICTRARSIGIEKEAAYVRCARQSASELNLSKVSFLEQDAREADLSCGTVFYLYTPFRGAMLREVLDLLRREGERRAIRVCTFGPCTAELVRENWLEPVGPSELGRVAVFKT
jgi:hypothetical protein